MLVEKKLETQLKNDIKNLENILYDSLNDEKNGIFNVQKRLDTIIKDMTPTELYDPNEFKEEIWKKVSEEWSKALSKQIIDTLSKELSKIVANRITDYIKSATITIPPGQTTTIPFAPSPLSGVTVSVSPKANIN